MRRRRPSVWGLAATVMLWAPSADATDPEPAPADPGRSAAAPEGSAGPTSLALVRGRLTIARLSGADLVGLGEIMMEESAFRRLPKNRSNALVHEFPSMLEYKSPTFLEMPPVTTYLVEDPDPEGPWGAKEVGQGPLLPIPPGLRTRCTTRSA